MIGLFHCLSCYFCHCGYLQLFITSPSDDLVVCPCLIVFPAFIVYAASVQHVFNQYPPPTVISHLLLSLAFPGHVGREKILSTFCVCVCVCVYISSFPRLTYE